MLLVLPVPLVPALEAAVLPPWWAVTVTLSPGKIVSVLLPPLPIVYE